MADQILSCNQLLNGDSSINGYNFVYQLDDGNGNNQVINVFIQGSDMKNTADPVEATTLANGAAATQKTNWLQSLSETSAPIPVAVASAVGPVMLQGVVIPDPPIIASPAQPAPAIGSIKGQ